MVIIGLQVANARYLVCAQKLIGTLVIKDWR